MQQSPAERKQKQDCAVLKMAITIFSEMQIDIEIDIDIDIRVHRYTARWD